MSLIPASPAPSVIHANLSMLPGVLLRGQHDLAFRRDVYDTVLGKNAHPAELDVLGICWPYQCVLLGKRQSSLWIKISFIQSPQAQDSECKWMVAPGIHSLSSGSLKYTMSLQLLSKYTLTFMSVYICYFPYHHDSKYFIPLSEHKPCINNISKHGLTTTVTELALVDRVGRSGTAQ